MAENLLELTAVTFTATQLAIKVKNISGKSLDQRLVIEFYPPAYLVDDKINAAAIAAATNDNPPGAKGLAGIVTGPQGWSIWVRRETSDSSLIIVLINDMDQNGGDLPSPVKLPAGGEFNVSIPLDPTANRAHIDLLYSYQQDTADAIHGKLELKPEQTTWNPDVTLFTTHTNPLMVKPGDLVKVSWKIKDGVSAILRGPLPGGNSEFELSNSPNADLKITEGSVDVRVMGAMTYVLQAQVTRPNNPNVEVVRMLSLDTPNNKYLYVYTNPQKVMPHGLIEINWAAWGVNEVEINVRNSGGTHTTRTIALTQQTKGRSYEGSGVMRISASKVVSEIVELFAEGLNKAGTEASVVSWRAMEKPDLRGQPLAIAMLIPSLAVLTTEGLFIAEVREHDPDPPMKKLPFNKLSRETPRQWLSLAAADGRFVVLRRTNQDDLEVAPYTVRGAAEDIAPLNLPADLRPLVAREGTTFQCVGLGTRVYVVIEGGLPEAKVRRAFSVAFDSRAKKGEFRPEPLLEPLIGYSLVSFDGALYALSPNSGRMFRYGVTKTGTVEEPRAAATAIKEDDPRKESMIFRGLFVPIGHVLAVLSPSSVPSVESLTRFGLQNVLSYEGQPGANPDTIPQDLVYNPQKNYWARCGHDLDVQTGALAAYRTSGSRRLWLIQPNLETHTLAVGSESLFAHDYVSAASTAALPPYLNKQREFRITNTSGMNFVAMSEKYRNAGLTGFSATGPSELTSRMPEGLKRGGSEAFVFRYNEADPSPIHIRFQLERPTGVKHDYFLEVTFSGHNLSTATSVFKRIAEDTQGNLSVAEIPGTTVKYTTDKPCVLPIPKPLVDGVRLRAQNATTYRLWRGATQVLYGGDEVIAYNTPAFSIYAHGAGELQVNVDFSLPPGIEITAGGSPQRKLIGIDTSRSTGLQAEVVTEAANVFEFKLNYVGKTDIKGVYIGDPVPTDNGDAIYLPVGSADNQKKPQILKINPETFAITATTAPVLYSVGGAFAMPNSIAVTREGVLALFDNEVWLLDTSLQLQSKQPYLSSVFTGFQFHPEGDCYLLEMNPNVHSAMLSSFTYHFRLFRGLFHRDSFRRELQFFVKSELLLDNVRAIREQSAMRDAPAWVPRFMSPMALAPFPASMRIRDVAVCINGGVFVAGENEHSIRSVALQNAGREEAVVYGREGLEIYCAHSQADNEGLRVSRVDTKTWKQTHGLSLPRGEGVADLTTDTRQRRPQDLFKASRSASMVRSADGKWLFVSHGRSIFRIDAATLTLRDSYKVDLPCRVFYVGWGKPTPDTHPAYGAPSSCTLLYAIGASYTGDGTNAKGNQFKTQLYRIAIRD